MQMLARAQSSNVKKGFIFEQKNLILSNILRQQFMYLYILHRIIVKKLAQTQLLEINHFLLFIP